MGHGPIEDYIVYRRERRQEFMPAERGRKKVRPRNKIDVSGICPEEMENLESWDSAGFDENAFIRIEGRSILLDRSVDVNGGILIANGGRLVFKDNGPAGERIKLSQVFKFQNFQVKLPILRIFF